VRHQLVTDGLPTRGDRPPRKTVVSPKRRLEHFSEAIRLVPAGTPVNTILLPMEGDPMAASAFWQLAVRTSGSCLSPTGDWP